jgi:hypothetical protein
MARADPAQPELALVTVSAHYRPSLERTLSEIFAALLACAAAFCIAVLAWLLLADFRRRKRMKSAPRLGADSPEFTTALGTATEALPPNPRGAVRFINLSRFLHHVVAEKKADAPSTDTWTESFFDLLKARWLDEPLPLAPSWLKEEMDRWFAAARIDRPIWGIRLSRAGVPAMQPPRDSVRAEDDHEDTARPANPPQSASKST